MAVTNTAYAGWRPPVGRTVPAVRHPRILGVAAVLLGAVTFVALAGVKPAYDAYGWLTWGREAWHLNLDTNAAPSWKPLTFLFTFPFALAGRGAVWLWMVTATAGAFAAPIPAARIAHHLSARGQGHGAAWVAAAVAAIGVLGLRGYWHFVLIFTADPLVVALCLGAIDCHLHRRAGAAFTLLTLAALGRPEVWPFLGLYAAWAWRALPATRIRLVAGLLLIPVLWFGVSALTSHSWFSAGDTALVASTPLRGNTLTGVGSHFLSLYELPLHLAALAAVALAVRRRDRAPLLLAAAAALWIAVWVLLALRGWEPDPRYMFEPAAVEVVLAATAVGSLLALRPGHLALRFAPAAGAVTLIVALLPAVPGRLRLIHNGILLGQNWARQLDRLQTVIARDGGGRGVMACGEVVTTVSYQSVLAWEVGENVAAVGWAPGQVIDSGQPMVLFLPYVAGWKVRPIHTASVAAAGCGRLRAITPYRYSVAFARFLIREHLLTRGGTACSLPGTPACPQHHRPLRMAVGASARGRSGRGRGDRRVGTRAPPRLGPAGYRPIPVPRA
jgi:hypothetical protein